MLLIIPMICLIKHLLDLTAWFFPDWKFKTSLGAFYYFFTLEVVFLLIQQSALVYQNSHCFKGDISSYRRPNTIRPLFQSLMSVFDVNVKWVLEDRRGRDRESCYRYLQSWGTRKLTNWHTHFIFKLLIIMIWVNMDIVWVWMKESSQYYELRQLFLKKSY